MELRHLYMLSELIKDKIDKKDLPDELSDNMEIILKYDPVTYYGIDKEFYYMTHNNSYNGFVHSEDEINAVVNDIKFKILPIKKETENV